MSCVLPIGTASVDDGMDANNDTNNLTDQIAYIELGTRGQGTAIITNPVTIRQLTRKDGDEDHILEHCEPQSLCMRLCGVCDYCGTRHGEEYVDQYEVFRLFGILACKECGEKAKRDIFAYRKENSCYPVNSQLFKRLNDNGIVGEKHPDHTEHTDMVNKFWFFGCFKVKRSSGSMDDNWTFQPDSESPCTRIYQGNGRYKGTLVLDVERDPRHPSANEPGWEHLEKCVPIDVLCEWNGWDYNLFMKALTE